MKKGTYSDVDDQSTELQTTLERKRRKILALTPPPNLFLFSPEDNEDEGKDLDLKLDLLSRSEESSNQFSSTLAMTDCDNTSNSVKTYDDKRDDSTFDKKQFCDLDFFKLMSEDEEDSSESGGLNLFNNSRYFEMVQQQDTNMNDVTKEVSLHQTKYESRRNIICPNVSPLSSPTQKDSCAKGRKDVLLNNQSFSPSAKPYGITSDKVSTYDR